MGRTTKKTKTEKLAEQVDSFEPEVNDDDDRDAKDPNNFIPTGSIMLNLGLSDMWNGGWMKGRMHQLIGDSSTGKTLVAVTTLACMTQEKRFDNYRLIFDDIERGCGFDITDVSKRLAERIEPPREPTEEDDGYSDSIEDFWDNITNAIEDGRPFVYIVDSWDSLDSLDDKKKLAQQKKDREEGKETKGSYGGAKPKKASELLRNIKSSIKKTDSILIIISQTRESMDTFSFEKRYVAGGKAIRFYSWSRMWLVWAGKITRGSDKKKVQIGGRSLIDIDKNRTTGKKRKVPMAIYDEFGLDDLGPTIDFMVEWSEKWKKSKASIKCPKTFLDGATMSRTKLIETIEAKGLEKELAKHAQKAWNEREASLKLNRKKRFH